MVCESGKPQKSCFLNFISIKYDFFHPQKPPPYVKMVKKKIMRKVSKILEKKKRLSNKTCLAYFSRGKLIPFDLG